jgi:hypothetical protein
MRKLLEYSFTVALFVFVVTFPSCAYAACPWYDPLCTPTPTPTPTPLSIQKLQVNPNIFQVVGTTNTPTPTVTNTPTPTLTPTPTTGATSTVAPSATVTPVLSPTTEPAITETPKPQEATVARFTNREKFLTGLVVIVIVLALIWSNWGKIKSWLHNKTA